MGGQTFELLGLVTLAGIAGVFSIVLATAGAEAFGSSAAVGLLFIGFALVLLLTAVSIGIWGVIDWIRADGTRATAASRPQADRDAGGRILTLSAALKQRAFIQLAIKVSFFCCTMNLGVEMFYLRRCERIFLIVTPPDHHYCDNLGYSPHGISSINPQSRTLLTELPGTVRLLPRARCARALRSARLPLAQRSVLLLTPECTARRGLLGSSARSFRLQRSRGRFWARRRPMHVLAVCSARLPRPYCRCILCRPTPYARRLIIRVHRLLNGGLSLQHAVLRGWTQWTASCSTRDSSAGGRQETSRRYFAAG